MDQTKQAKDQTNMLLLSMFHGREERWEICAKSDDDKSFEKKCYPG